MGFGFSEAHCLFCFFVGEDLFGNIYGSTFALLEDAAHIFADDADANQLDATQQQDQHNDTGVARNRDTPDQFLQHHHDQIDHGCEGGDATKKGGKPQRRRGVADNAFDGIVEQFPEIPLCGACMALTGGVGDELGVKPYPCENALGEAVIFCKFQNAVPYAAAESAKIAGIRLQLNLG